MRTIYFIYVKEQTDEAENILSFLNKEKEMPVISRNDVCYILGSDERIAEDSAVILISDDAVLDNEWQAAVRQLPENIRLIPVGGTENADYSNPEVIPPQIEAINFIRMNENCCENIWDSLTIEKDFYQIKNTLLSNLHAWAFSNGSEAFLLSDIDTINAYLLILRKKWKKEKNPYIAEELSAIIKYLNTSLRYVKQLKRERIVNNIKRIGIIVAAVVAVVMFYKKADNAKRMRFAQTILSVDTQAGLLPINAVKLVEGIVNSSFPDSVKPGLYNKLSEFLNSNWYNTPLGINYKWALNDAQVAEDEQYVWAVTGNGTVTKWDSYSGEIVEQAQVSSLPLNVFAASEGEEFFAAVDADGYILKRHIGEAWEKSEKNYDIPFVQGCRLLCFGEQNSLIIAGTNGKLFYFETEPEINLIWEKQYERILCIELNEQGIEAVVWQQDELYDLCIGPDGEESKTLIPITYDGICSMDILNGTVLMSDENMQIVTWNKENPEVLSTWGLVLSRPLLLRFFHENVIVYYDKNTGIHLYDLERKLDLGKIFRDVDAVSSIKVSQNTVLILRSDGVYHTENVEILLPTDDLQDQDIYAIYTEKEAVSDGKIKKASIENEYMIRVELHSEEGDMTLMLDGGSRYYIGRAQADFSLVDEESDTYYHKIKPVNFTGKPAVIGIIDNGETLLAGGTDGAFFEIGFTENGDFLRGSQLQIPSHAAIVGIYQTEDFYYIEDETGTMWKARIGYDAFTEEGVIQAVKEKLHYAMDKSLLESISEDTVKKLELKWQPGEGKEWE